MSLKSELAKDRRNVMPGKNEEGTNPLLTVDVVEGFFRTEIVPHFYQAHFNKTYRDADQLKLEINFTDPNLYKITSIPVWSNDQKKTEQFGARIPFAQERYTAALLNQKKDQLWSWIAEIASHEEWQAEGKIDLEKKVVTLILDLN